MFPSTAQIRPTDPLPRQPIRPRRNPRVPRQRAASPAGRMEGASWECEIQDARAEKGRGGVVARGYVHPFYLVCVRVDVDETRVAVIKSFKIMQSGDYGRQKLVISVP